MSLLYEKILKCYLKPILFYRLTDTLTKDNISATQHKLQYDTGAAMQENVAQHWWYRTILTTLFQLLVNFPDSFGEEPSSLRLRKLMIAGKVTFAENTRSK